MFLSIAIKIISTLEETFSYFDNNINPKELERITEFIQDNCPHVKEFFKEIEYE